MTVEYIPREAAKDIFNRESHYLCDDDFGIVIRAENLIDAIPTADVRPVVFCRNCIHYKPQQKSARWSNTTPMCSRSATIKMPPDGFCSFGVEREDDTK